MNKWFVYILECNDGRLYTGMTNNVERRVREHRSGKGARFTCSFGVRKLLYHEQYKTKSEAMKREAQIKRLPKIKKLALIKVK